MLINEIKFLKLPERSKYGVGKSIGGYIYVHKQYATDIIPIDVLQRGLKLTGNFSYTILKYNPKIQSISFIESTDFDTNPEPTIGRVMLIKSDSEIPKIMNPSSDPWIYHHKWLMVKDNYMGFDVEKSKQRSLDWMALYPDYSRIGKQSYWKNNVLPLL